MARKNHESPNKGRHDLDESYERLQALRAELVGNSEPQSDDADEEVADIFDDTYQNVPAKTDEEIARDVAPSLVPFLDDITLRINADKANFTGDEKKWSLVRAQRDALVGSGAYAGEDVDGMTNEQVKLLLAAAYAVRREARKAERPTEVKDPEATKQQETEPLSDESLAILARLEKALATTGEPAATTKAKQKNQPKFPRRSDGGVNQSTLDAMENTTRVWEIDEHNPDYEEAVRYRRKAARGTAPKGASSPAVTTPGFAGVAPTPPPVPRTRRTPAAASPRVVDPRLADTISYDARGHAHWRKGVADRGGKFAHNGHIDTILGGYDERERQNALYAEAQKIHAAVTDIDAEIAIGPAPDDIAIMRRQLVAHHAFGADTALKVGNMSDEEVKEFVSYMRTAHDKATTAPASPATPTDPLDALLAGTYTPAPAPADPLDALAAGTYVPATTGDILAALATGTYVPRGEMGTAMSPEITAMMNELSDYRDTYARLTAKDRTSYVGRFLSDDSRRTRFLRRMPFVARTFDAWNERRSEAIDDARMEYEAHIDRLIGRLDAIAGMPTDRSSRQRRALLNESFQLETRISDYIKERGAERAGMFTTWWMKQEGDTSKWKWRSRLKKVGAVAAISGATAFGAGFLVPGAIFGIASGAAIGGATGGLLGRSVTRHRGNARVTVGRGSEMSYADIEAAYNTNRQFDALNTDAAPTAATLTREVETKSNEEIVRNRRRIRSAVAAGKLAGGLSGFGASQLRARVFPGTTEVAQSTGSGDQTGGQIDGDHTNPGANEGVGPNDRYVTRLPEVLQGNTFDAEPSSGFIREWSQWADANNHHIDEQTARQLHDAVRTQFGDKGIITKLGTYVENGDLRIARSGATSWANGVPEFAQQWLAARGKW
jgi:hypothetical protein